MSPNTDSLFLRIPTDLKARMTAALEAERYRPGDYRRRTLNSIAIETLAAAYPPAPPAKVARVVKGPQLSLPMKRAKLKRKPMKRARRGSK